MTEVHATEVHHNMAEETGLRGPDHLAARRSGPVPADRPSCCARRSSNSWSPLPLPANTQLKRLVDRFLPRGGLLALST